MVVVTDIDLHDVDTCVECGCATVIDTDRHAVVIPDVGGLVRGEDHRLRLLDAP